MTEEASTTQASNATAGAMLDIADLQRYALQGQSLKQAMTRYVARQKGQQGLGTAATSRKGMGMMFHSVREYALGDEVRHIDWRVTARTGRAHLKQFVEEQKRSIWLILDDRPAMQFATEGCFKQQQMAKIAYLLAGAAIAAGEDCGMVIARPDDRMADSSLPSSQTQALWLFPPSAKPWQILAQSCLLMAGKAMMKQNSKLAVDGNRGLIAAMQWLVQHQLRYHSVRAQCFILSDFLDIRLKDNDPALQDALRHLQQRMDITLITIRDVADMQLPKAGWLQLQAQQGRAVTVNLSDGQLQQRWQQWADAREAWLQDQQQAIGFGG